VKPAKLDLEPEVRAPSDGLLPDFSGQSMRQVLSDGRALGLNVVLEGTGLAVRQIPRPGSPLQKITSVKVRFSPPR